MPDLIVCPHCREPLDIPPEYHHRQVRCASCQTVFLATPADADAVPVAPRLPSSRTSRRSEDDDQDRDRDSPPPRRSNAGVVLLLLLTVGVVGGCCGGLNLILVYQMNPTVTSYTSVEGKFKADFPGDTPTGGPLMGGGDGAAGWQVTGQRASANERYTVRCYDLKPEWRRLSEQDALAKVVEADLPAIGRRRTEQTTHGGFPALDLLDTQGQGLNGSSTVTRLVLAGKRVYVVSAQGQPNFHTFWWVRQYFTSFDITDPVAKPKPNDEPKKEKKQD